MSNEKRLVSQLVGDEPGLVLRPSLLLMKSTKQLNLWTLLKKSVEKKVFEKTILYKFPHLLQIYILLSIYNAWKPFRVCTFPAA